MSRVTEETREEIARVLQIVADDGLPKPRDLDVAIDAIIGAFPPGVSGLLDGTKRAVPVEATEARRWEKNSGDYTFEGVEVARFKKRSGVERVVLEDDRGLLFIFTPSALAASQPNPKEQE